MRNIGLNAQVQTVWASKWSSVQGFEYYYDRVDSKRLDTDLGQNSSSTKRGLYPDGATMGQWAFYSLHRYALKTWTLTGGMRYNGYSININDGYAGQAELRPTALVWNAALLKTMPWGQVFASLNTAFRAPNIDDLGTLGIVDFRYEVPNNTLSPEKAFNKAFGWRWQVASKWRGEVHFFHNNLSQIIARVRVDTQTVQGYPLYQKTNIEKGFTRGFEAQSSYDIHTNWRIEAAIAYIYGQNQTLNEPMRRIPPFNGRLAVTYRYKRFMAQADTRFAQTQTRLAAGDKADNRIPPGGTTGWWLINAMAAYQTAYGTISVIGHNLGNADYRLHGSGVNGMGRSATVQLALHF